MASRNELLEQIVIAVGGTVRDPNNRNKLLEDWLCAIGGACPLIALWSVTGVLNCNGTVICSEIIKCGV